MDKITRKLFDGEIHAFETTVPQDPEYWKIQKRMGEIEDQLMGKLEEEDRPYCEEWANLRLDLADIHDFALFHYGYCLGVQLICEAFYGINDNQRVCGEYEKVDENKIRVL